MLIDSFTYIYNINKNGYQQIYSLHSGISLLKNLQKSQRVNTQIKQLVEFSLIKLFVVISLIL